MFCSECGSEAQGKFCWNCGTPLLQGQAASSTPEPASLELVGVDTSGPSVLPIEWLDWSEEIQYETLLKHPEVREMIAAHAAQAAERVSGEQYLELCDIALKPLVGGVPISKVAALMQPLYASWGIGTGKSRTEVVTTPAGKVLVSVLCSLAKNSQQVEHVEQGEDGCVIEAQLPADIWALAGTLVIAVERTRGGTKVEAATKISGQFVDWGKSRRALQRLFDDTAVIVRAA